MEIFLVFSFKGLYDFKVWKIMDEIGLFGLLIVEFFRDLYDIMCIKVFKKSI